MRKVTDHHTQDVTSMVVQTGIGKGTDDFSRRAFHHSCADPPACTLIIFLIHALKLPARLI
jgi:hypothetical protein